MPVTRNQALIPQLFRLEYTRMTAVLCRHFGLRNIVVAEDIVSETFLKATEVWDLNSLPENPVAWLYAVAKNKTKDYLKRHAIFEAQVKREIKHEALEADPDFNEESISDSQLAMIFAVCNPGNSTEAQICLALQILCGFSIEEIADAFLSKKETIRKRLLRAKNVLRQDNFQIRTLQQNSISSRLDTVLRTLYLLFNEGYFSKSNNQLIRKELCSEAIRLTLFLTENEWTNTPQTNALLALMCFQSSRLAARTNDSGETILYEHQDKSLWSQELIDKGNYYLVNAYSGTEISKYHLEAGIAYWHTSPTDQHKWEHILQLYNQLILIEYSPVTALNRTFALARVYGNERGIQEVEKLKLTGHSEYYALLAYLHKDTAAAKAIDYYQKAITLTKSLPEKETLNREMEKLNKKKSDEDEH
ncbi:RNA polymerase sigma-70 factor (ECF subfamily) [Pedobacter cryoconitis]|uniref:RNA polymerase sigma-70 factor (ECF subfamily) n=1 Tax=Pedobacter cryoconitis TaxID=188932 RepID=A0A7W8YU52_9SPHI|nr:sigma-70 family RNA polymerase sigma factor [Pedobacter cryoconitis]MBB5621851.1 RNA polymerase sigma-70 factor (ECF subfamily) [Pedobacter cryoconitis]